MSARFAIFTIRSGSSTGKIDPFLIGNRRQQKVFWAVAADQEDAPCQPNGNWRLELRFDNSNDGNNTPWNNGPVSIRSNGNAITPWRIPNNANVGKFPYHVWMIPPNGGGDPYEILDPELQIEQ